MFDFAEILEPPATAESTWTIPPRSSDSLEVAAAARLDNVVFVTGYVGSGKTSTIAAAIEHLRDDGTSAGIVPATSSISGAELDRQLRACTPFEQLLVGVDSPEALASTTLELLAEKITCGACVALIECTDRAYLPQQLATLRNARTAQQREIAPLNEVETFTHLTAYLKSAVVAESAFRLWHATGGITRLMTHWVPELVSKGEFKRGRFGWYWDGFSAPTPSLTALVTEQFCARTGDQQQFLEYLVLGESLTRSTVAKFIEDEQLAELNALGLSKFHVDEAGNARVVLCAPIWGDAKRPHILPARRSQIFTELAKPTTHGKDDIAMMAWTMAAIEDGYPLTYEDLVGAAQSAYLRRRFDCLELFVNQRFPPTLTREGHLQRTSELSDADKNQAAQLLVLRAMGFHLLGQHQSALYDVHTARAILDEGPVSLRPLYGSLALVESSILRGMPTGQHKVKDLFDTEIGRALSVGDQLTAQTLQVQALSLPIYGAELQPHVDMLKRVFSDEEVFTTFAVTILPELIYLSALAGKLDEAVALADSALKARSLKNSLDAEHAFPWAYAEVASARYMVAAWKGDFSAGLSELDSKSVVLLVDSAVYQTGAGRTLANFSQWEQAAQQYLGALERFENSDPLGRRKYAFAGYVQAMAALGHKSEVAALIKEYDSIEYLTVAILASDADYQVLTAAVAAGVENLHERIQASLFDSEKNGLWFSVLRAAHLGVVASSGTQQKKYLAKLEQAAELVDEPVSTKFLNDGRAVAGGSTDQQMKARAELAAIGAWIPQREIGVRLTRRQKEIVELVSRGYTNRDIAEKLVLSVRTVDAHVSSILARTGAADRKDLAAKVRSFL